jgi:hypothetical protein
MPLIYYYIKEMKNKCVYLYALNLYLSLFCCLVYNNYIIKKKIRILHLLAFELLFFFKLYVG